MVNVNKANYKTFSPEDQQSINKQIEEMIQKNIDFSIITVCVIHI